MDRPHEYISVDKAIFNLAKRRRRLWNIIGQQVIVQVPGQRGGKVTLCGALGDHEVPHCQHTFHISSSLLSLRMCCLGVYGSITSRQSVLSMAIVWDNVVFHRSVQVQERFPNVRLKTFFSAWRWKVLD